MEKLLVASDRYFPEPNGLVRFLDEVVPRLSKSFHVTLVVPDLGETSQNIMCQRIAFIKTLPIRIADFKIPRPSFSRIKRLVDESDIVFVNDLGPIGLISFYYARKFNKPVYAYTHVIEWELMIKSLRAPLFFRKLLASITKKVVSRIYNKMNTLMVPSETVASTFATNGVTSKNVVIPLAVNQDKFKPSDCAEAKKKLGLDDKFVIGYSGRISKEKNIEALVEAFKILRKSDPDVELLIIGDGPAVLKKGFVEAGVRITGFVDDVENYLPALDVFVLPSLTETTSLSTMEAMSCGLPVIVTHIGSSKEYIEQGVNGLFFPRGDIQVLAERIQSLINDAELRKRLGDSGRQTVEVHYSWDATVEKMVSAFRNMNI